MITKKNHVKSDVFCEDLSFLKICYFGNTLQYGFISSNLFIYWLSSTYILSIISAE